MRTMVRIAGRCKGGSKGQASLPEPGRELLGLDSRVELIQALIPLGLEGVNDLLQQEVTALVDIEPRLGRVCGCKHLVRLRAALQTRLKGCLEQVA